MDNCHCSLMFVDKVINLIYKKVMGRFIDNENSCQLQLYLQKKHDFCSLIDDVLTGFLFLFPVLPNVLLYCVLLLSGFESVRIFWLVLSLARK